ncbi:MBL fold metallo-hydrolase [Nocardioides sp. ChNu-153]|uniref:MBL fold metallo-hydrolase n=1 Tax=unclassified Nocardioides TaxID=2615069 RepID=UPI0024062C61|nr:MULTISPECIES: MBL fold metallo-hydrolase [unclassified Nocardioides]MDF9717155.1 MBL fold metallo-hydrolase [Nocardioides sp. ChNu-99]MDN7122674.1 MBL fold metallo-hydrolase [Nocardioides sp. ChNu-153]
MRLTIVGCAGSYPGPTSPASCYLLEAEGPDGDGGTRTWRILLDLGNGALGALHNHADPLAVDAVFVSHLHPDHCLDLCGYYVLRKYHPAGPQPRIPVWGPEGAADRMARAYDLPLDPGMREEFDFREYAVERRAIEVGPFSVQPFEVFHPVPAYALRVSAGGRTLTYSGDTAPCLGLDRAAAGVDLLLAEAAFRARDENAPGVHLTGTDAGDLATRGAVGRLVLTHVPAWFDPQDARTEAVARYDGPTSVAVAGAVYDV